MRLGKIRIHGPVRLFKGLHCTTPLFDLRRRLQTWQIRKHDIWMDEAGAAVN